MIQVAKYVPRGAKCLYTPSLYTTGCIAQNTSPSTSQLRRCLILQRLTKHPLLEHFSVSFYNPNGDTWLMPKIQIEFF